MWELCNCKSKEEWDNLSVRAKYDRKNRRGLVEKKADYTPSLTKVDLQQYIDDILLDKDGNVEVIYLVDGTTAQIYSSGKYKSVSVGKKKSYMLHRILYAWFIGNIPRNMVVDHINNDSNDNNIHNLQLLDRKTNVQKDYKVIKNQYTSV